MKNKIMYGALAAVIGFISSWISYVYEEKERISR